jgi:hypothetical protein
MRGRRIVGRAAPWALAVSLALAPCAARAADPGVSEENPETAAIRFYQQYLSSLRHGHCRFHPSCSEYAAQAIAKYGVVEGSARAADRLMRCNASAEGSYPRNADGLLEDPVEESLASSALRAPRWLRLPPEPPEPPLPATLDPVRRGRVDETVAFALELEQRGDCERAATEYQRAGSLAGAAATDAWAFARIGECQSAASQWALAERAHLTSGMLSPDSTGRARAVYRAALCRFDASTFSACERLLADPAIAASSVAGAPARDSALALCRVAALGGLCAMALGDWSRASERFALGSSLALAPDDRDRIGRLAPFVAEGPELPHCSPGLAGTLSAVIPGTGQMYCGRGRDGFRHLLFDGVLIWTVVSLASNEHVPAAVLTAGVALPFYLGNIHGAASAARQHDRVQRLDLVQRAIRASAR